MTPVCSSGKNPSTKTLPDLKRLCPFSIISGLFSIKREEMDKVEKIVAGWVKDLCLHKAGKEKETLKSDKLKQNKKQFISFLHFSYSLNNGQLGSSA